MLLRTIVLVLAIVAFVIAALIGHGDILSDQGHTWQDIGLALLAASFLPFERWSK